MNWLELLRLTQHFVFLSITLTEPAKLRHLVVLVKTWQYRLVVVKIINSCSNYGMMNVTTTPTILDHVIPMQCVVIIHRWVIYTYVTLLNTVHHVIIMCILNYILFANVVIRWPDMLNSNSLHNVAKTNQT